MKKIPVQIGSSSSGSSSRSSLSSSFSSAVGSDGSKLIPECAAGKKCRAPTESQLADSPHNCWGCIKKIHSALQCEIILEEVDVTPTFCTASVKKVIIRIGGKIIGSIDDDVVYEQPDFEKAVEHVEPTDDDVDFGWQDNDHAEENAETRKVGGLQRRRKLGHWILCLLWIQTFCVTLHSGKLKKGI